MSELQLLVLDNERGIFVANTNSLFTPFFTTKCEHGGTGLDYRLCKRYPTCSTQIFNIRQHCITPVLQFGLLQVHLQRC